MDFWKAILGLLRRRYIGPPLAALAIMVAAVAFLLTPASYVSSATMVLTTPTSGGTLSQDKPPGQTNPLLNFDDGLKTTSTILIQAVNTPEVAEELGASGGGTKVIINDGNTNPNLLGSNGPFVYIEGESTSAERARDVVLRAQQRVREELITRQQELKAPPITYITIVDVVAPSTPEAQSSTRLQNAGVALVFTVLFGLGGAYAAQRLLASRRKGGEPKTPAERPDLPIDPATVRFAPVPHPGGNGTNGAKVPKPQPQPTRPGR